MPYKLLEDLNKDQKEAVLHSQGPALVFAGAGSGKTRTLSYRAAYLIGEKNIDPQRILIVTFTNKAADEIKNRINLLLAHRPGSLPAASTFHSWCARILRQEAKLLKIQPNYIIYDSKDQLNTVREALKKLGLSEKQNPPNSILNTISQAKNELISHLEYPQYARGYFQKTVSRVYVYYQRLLTEYNALDFDDLLLKSVYLLKNFPSVLDKYKKRYQHLLVDEYQDTNQAQYILSKLLSSYWQSLFVVGDCSQSIYSWRGADYRNVLKLQKDFPGLKTYHLEQNYRSPKNILTAAFAVIKKNTSHPVLKLWTDKQQGEMIELFSALNEKKEAQFIVDKINEEIMQNPRRTLSSFAVLYRTNAQSRNLEEAFMRDNINYTLVGGTRFYDRAEVKDCLAYLRLLANPQDGMARKRVEKIGKRKMQKFFDWLEKANKENVPTVELLNQILQATAYLEKYNSKDPQDLSRLENIKELRSAAVEFPLLDDFLQNLALDEEYISGRQNNSGKDTVVLMTLHSAKGLEFDTVFMIGMEEGLFPHSRSILEKNELEEERRLCYVGITRTKHKLFLTYCRKRLYFGTSMYNTISRFIADIPPEIICQK